MVVLHRVSLRGITFVDGGRELGRVMQTIEEWKKMSNLLNKTKLLSEIDCRIEHGADSNGHLEGLVGLINSGAFDTSTKQPVIILGDGSEARIGDRIVPIEIFDSNHSTKRTIRGFDRGVVWYSVEGETDFYRDSNAENFKKYQKKGDE